MESTERAETMGRKKVLPGSKHKSNIERLANEILEGRGIMLEVRKEDDSAAL